MKLNLLSRSTACVYLWSRTEVVCLSSGKQYHRTALGHPGSAFRISTILDSSTLFIHRHLAPAACVPAPPLVLYHNYWFHFVLEDKRNLRGEIVRIVNSTALSCCARRCRLEESIIHNDIIPDNRDRNCWHELYGSFCSLVNLSKSSG
jgi:hypothetical protein